MDGNRTASGRSAASLATVLAKLRGHASPQEEIHQSCAVFARRLCVLTHGVILTLWQASSASPDDAASLNTIHDSVELLTLLADTRYCSNGLFAFGDAPSNMVSSALLAAIRAVIMTPESVADQGSTQAATCAATLLAAILEVAGHDLFRSAVNEVGALAAALINIAAESEMQNRDSSDVAADVTELECLQSVASACDFSVLPQELDENSVSISPLALTIAIDCRKDAVRSAAALLTTLEHSVGILDRRHAACGDLASASRVAFGMRCLLLTLRRVTNACTVSSVLRPPRLRLLAAKAISALNAAYEAHFSGGRATNDTSVFATLSPLHIVAASSELGDASIIAAEVARSASRCTVLLMQLHVDGRFTTREQRCDDCWNKISYDSTSLLHKCLVRTRSPSGHTDLDEALARSLLPTLLPAVQLLLSAPTPYTTETASGMGLRDAWDSLFLCSLSILRIGLSVDESSTIPAVSLLIRHVGRVREQAALMDVFATIAHTRPHLAAFAANSAEVEVERNYVQCDEAIREHESLTSAQVPVKGDSVDAADVEMLMTAEGAQVPTGAADGVIGTVKQKESTWVCSVCTLINTEGSRCDTCGSSRRVGASRTKSVTNESSAHVADASILSDPITAGERAVLHQHAASVMKSDGAHRSEEAHRSHSHCVYHLRDTDAIVFLILRAFVGIAPLRSSTHGEAVGSPSVPQHFQRRAEGNARGAQLLRFVVPARSSSSGAERRGSSNEVETHTTFITYIDAEVPSLPQCVWKALESAGIRESDDLIAGDTIDASAFGNTNQGFTSADLSRRARLELGSVHIALRLVTLASTSLSCGSGVGESLQYDGMQAVISHAHTRLAQAGLTVLEDAMQRLSGGENDDGVTEVADALEGTIDDLAPPSWEFAALVDICEDCLALEPLRKHDRMQTILRSLFLASNFGKQAQPHSVFTACQLLRVATIALPAFLESEPLAPNVQSAVSVALEVASQSHYCDVPTVSSLMTVVAGVCGLSSASGQCPGALQALRCIFGLLSTLRTLRASALSNNSEGPPLRMLQSSDIHIYPKEVVDCVGVVAQLCFDAAADTLFHEAHTELATKYDTLPSGAVARSSRGVASAPSASQGVATTSARISGAVLQTVAGRLSRRLQHAVTSTASAFAAAVCAVCDPQLASSILARVVCVIADHCDAVSVGVSLLVAFERTVVWPVTQGHLGNAVASGRNAEGSVTSTPSATPSAAAPSGVAGAKNDRKLTSMFQAAPQSSLASLSHNHATAKVTGKNPPDVGHFSSPDVEGPALTLNALRGLLGGALESDPSSVPFPPTMITALRILVQSRGNVASSNDRSISGNSGGDYDATARNRGPNTLRSQRALELLLDRVQRRRAAGEFAVPAASVNSAIRPRPPLLISLERKTRCMDHHSSTVASRSPHCGVCSTFVTQSATQRDLGSSDVVSAASIVQTMDVSKLLVLPQVSPIPVERAPGAASTASIASMIAGTAANSSAPRAVNDLFAGDIVVCPLAFEAVVAVARSVLQLESSAGTKTGYHLPAVCTVLRHCAAMRTRLPRHQMISTPLNAESTTNLELAFLSYALQAAMHRAAGHRSASDSGFDIAGALVAYVICAGSRPISASELESSYASTVPDHEVSLRRVLTRAACAAANFDPNAACMPPVVPFDMSPQWWGSETCAYQAPAVGCVGDVACLVDQLLLPRVVRKDDRITVVDCKPETLTVAIALAVSCHAQQRSAAAAAKLASWNSECTGNGWPGEASATSVLASTTRSESVLARTFTETRLLTSSQGCAPLRTAGTAGTAWVAAATPQAASPSNASLVSMSRITSLPAVNVAESLVWSSNAVVAHTVLQVLNTWAVARLQLRSKSSANRVNTTDAKGAVTTPFQDAAAKARVVAAVISLRTLAANFGQTLWGLLSLLANEVYGRLAVVLLHPQPDVLVSAALTTIEVDKQETATATAANATVANSSHIAPLLPDFVRDVLLGERSEVEAMREMLPHILPVLFVYRGGQRLQLEVLAAYLAADTQSVQVMLNSALSKAPGPSSAADTGPVVGAKRISGSTPSTSRAATTGAAAAKRQRTMSEYTAARQTPAGESRQTPTPMKLDEVDDGYSASDVQLGVSQLAFADLSMMTPHDRRLQLARLVSSRAADVFVRILMTPCPAIFADASLSLLAEHMPNGVLESLPSDQFQAILEPIVWYLGEAAIDGPSNRSAAALRAFASVLLGDARRLNTPRTYPTKRLREAAHTVLAAVHSGGDGLPPAWSHSFLSVVSPGRMATPVSIRPTASTALSAPTRASGGVAAAGTEASDLTSPYAPAYSRLIAAHAHVAFTLPAIGAATARRPVGAEDALAALREGVKNMQMPMELLLQRYLLMLLSRLSAIVSRGGDEVLNLKGNALLVLQRLLVRVGGDAKLDKHVPAIMAILRLALETPALRVAAAAAWDTFVRLLSNSTLANYFVSIIVVLARAVDASGESDESSAPFSTDSDDFGSRGRGGDNAALAVVSKAYDAALAADLEPLAAALAHKPHAAMARSGEGAAQWEVPVDGFGVPLRPISKSGTAVTAAGIANPAGSGSAISRSATPSNSLQQTGRMRDALRAAAAATRAVQAGDLPFGGCVTARELVHRTLRYLIVERRPGFFERFASIPGTALMPALRPFTNFMLPFIKAPNDAAETAGDDGPAPEPERRALDFKRRISRLTELLRSSDSEAVQELALRELDTLLVDNATGVHALVLQNSAAGDAAVSPILADLISELLELNRRTVSIHVRQQCGAVLGQIGAIDPARMLGAGGAGGGYSGSGTLHGPELTDELLAVELLRSCLVKALRGAVDTGQQDRIAYAVQELVRFYGKLRDLRGANEVISGNNEGNERPASTSTAAAAPQASSGDALGKRQRRAVRTNSASGATATSRNTTTLAVANSTRRPEAMIISSGSDDDDDASEHPDHGDSAMLVDDGDIASGASGFVGAVGGVSYATEGVTTGSVALPRDFERTLLEDIRTLDKRDAVDASSDVANGVATVRDMIDVIAPYWSSRLVIVRPLVASSNREPFYLAALAAAVHAAQHDTIHYSRELTSAASSTASSRSPRGAVHFEKWVADWCRHMIDALCSHKASDTAPAPMTATASVLTKGISVSPRIALWTGLRPALQGNLSTALFVLPYLLRDVLSYGSEPLLESVVREVRAVLRDGIVADGDLRREGGSDSNVDDDVAAGHVSDTATRIALVRRNASPAPSSSGGSAVAAFRHRATQTVFTALDTVQTWVAVRATKAGAGTVAPIQGSRTGGVGPANDAAMAADEPTEMCAVRLEKLFKVLTYRALADAAFRIHAFARAYLYMETHLRRTAAHGHGSARVPNPETGLLEAGSVGGLVSGSVPYTRPQLSYLQAIYAHMDEPDGIAGIGALRLRLLTPTAAGAVGGLNSGSESASAVTTPGPPLSPMTLRTEQSTTLRERIIDFEHEGRWTDALVCYEQALQQHQAHVAELDAAAADLVAAETAPHTGSAVMVGSKTPIGTPRAPTSQEPSRTRASPARVLLPTDASHIANRAQRIAAARADAESLELSLHAGVLRCLKNVGHLETALHRAVGVLGWRPDLAPVVTPHAVEAAWRLAQWGPLERLLAFQGTASDAAADPGSSNEPAEFNDADGADDDATLLLSGHGGRHRAADISADYDTSIGSALLQLHRASETPVWLPTTQIKEPSDSAMSISLTSSSTRAPLGTMHSSAYALFSQTVSGMLAACGSAATLHPPISSLPIGGSLKSAVVVSGHAHNASAGLASADALATCMSSLTLVAGRVLEPSPADLRAASQWSANSTCGGPFTPVSLTRTPYGFTSPNAAASSMSLLHGRAQHLTAFREALAGAQRDVLAGLAAAAAESYTRAYPFLLRLHSLREIEMAAKLLVVEAPSAAVITSAVGGGVHSHSVVAGPAAAAALVSDRERVVKSWAWDSRLNATSPSLQPRESMLALRRALFRIFGLRSLEAGGWLDLARIAKVAGNVPTATSALLHAAALGSDDAPILSAKLLYEAGETHRALMELEPVERDIDAIVLRLKSARTAAHSAAHAAKAVGGVTATDAAAAAAHADRACELEARRLLCATNWRVESRLLAETDAVARYRAVISLAESWEKAHFCLGRYYDTLHKALSGPDAPLPPESKRAAECSEWTRRRDNVLLAVVENYGAALVHGHRYIFHSLPRILTLYFDYGAVAAAATSVEGQRSTMYHEAAARTGMYLPKESTVDILTKSFVDIRTRMMGYRWMTVLPQLISRVCHRHPSVWGFIISTLSAILHAFPAQASWFVVGLRMSRLPMRKARAEMVRVALRAYPNDIRVIGQLEVLFEQLIRIAAEVPPNSAGDKYTIDLNERLNFKKCNIMVPLLSSLTVLLPGRDLADAAGGFPRESPHISGFLPRADVMSSKERPKKVTITASDGATYAFLVKQERRGDLRKDARMMEAATLVNRVLAKDGEGRRRKLRLRTYAVVCLNEECGLLQWVPRTAGFRGECAKAYAAAGLQPPTTITKSIRATFESLQTDVHDDGARATRYRADILPQFPAVFHLWFTASFADPSAWFEARLAFTRSCAAWSMVGHVVGLGDRHGENLLLDRNSGEVVHVDYDCIFDKGMHLQRPELVPFRLTPNMLDAMGPAGYEGVFRRCSETAMRVLRRHTDMLVSVLESFIHDPLVEWQRRKPPTATANSIAAGGGAGAASNAAAASMDRGVAGGGEDPSTAAGAERENEDGIRMIRRVRERLSGIYNTGPEWLPARNGSNSSRARAAAALQAQLRLFGSLARPGLAVPGQVHRLIKEAVSDENLCLMYVGWLPML